ncbi:angiopoietin-related protein 7-like isoform X2 [Cydia pomonella]|uniref:angiopoietin-related protein 7-like isoform X2 n=1 Tax=Cydia pomonella TaxID=82600 RepID=UPI002ADD8512|nr:angiopoietin-related protein 7-like isoform X2 [Cydia pomonella]
MLLLNIILSISMLTISNGKETKKKIINMEDASNEDSNSYLNEKLKTIRPVKGEAVVEKFVETLMSSERYLKLVETVERKLNHLDNSFHEKTSSVMKYLTEILRMLQPLPDMEELLKSVRMSLESVSETLNHIPMGRTADSGLEERLSQLEGSVRSAAAGIDTIMATIAEVKNRPYASKEHKSDSMDASSLISEFRRTLQEHKSKKCDCKSVRVDRSERYPLDCYEIQMQGFNVSGIFKIHPDGMEPFYVLCDLSTAGGGWTVFQNRFDGSQDFYKSWTDYKYGFGNLAGEFWLGLDKLHYLTNQKLYELRVELETQNGHEAYAAYSVLTIGPEYEGYRMSTLGTYYGTAGDSLSYHAGQKFSAMDMDHDEWKDGSCAVEHGGAWWYKECDKSNLNGVYVNSDERRAHTIYWISFKGPSLPLTRTKMMIRPLPARRPVDYPDQIRHMTEMRSEVQGHVKPSHGKGVKSKARRPDYRLGQPAASDAFYAGYA